MKFYLTQKDFDYLNNQIIDKEVRTKELYVKLGEAAKKSGSFVVSNPEYMGIKSQIDTLESIINSLKDLLTKSEVKELNEMGNEVTNYSLVTTENEDGEEIFYYIQIPALETSLSNEIVVASPQSPVGSKLLDKKVGDRVTITLPNKTISLKILKIEKI